MKDKIVEIYNGLTIYLSEKDNEFYACNMKTKEEFRDRSLPKLMEKIDNPKWESYDASAFGVREAWDGATRIKAIRRDVECKHPDWRITQSSRSNYYTKDIGEEYHPCNTQYPTDLIGFFEVNENNKKVFKKVKEKLQQLKDLEDEINNILKTEFTGKLSSKQVKGRDDWFYDRRYCNDKSDEEV